MDYIYSETANCTPQDETELLIIKERQKEKIKEIEKTKKENFKKKMIDKVSNSLKVKDCINYDLDRTDARVVRSSLYDDEIVKHYASKAVCKIKKLNEFKNCPACLASIATKNSETLSNITKIRDWGGLSQPSNELHYICHVIETVVQKNIKIIKHPNIYSIIFKETLNQIPHNIFSATEDPPHTKEHAFSLINKILTCIISMRISHTSKIELAENDPDIKRFRVQNVKVNQFTGQ